MSTYSVIADAVSVGNTRRTKETVQKALANGKLAMDIIDQGLMAGLDEVGRRFQNGEAFFTDMVLAAAAVRDTMPIVTRRLGHAEYKHKATMVIGTVQGDLHSIGKELVSIVLRSRGFNIIDLGVDVHESMFVDAVKVYEPEFVGMSCLLTTTLMSIERVIHSLTIAELRQDVMVVLGGAAVSEKFTSTVGADGYAVDAVSVGVVLERLLDRARGKN